MVTDLPVMTYSIYKLTFAPYMEGLIPGKLSKAKLKKLVSCVFDAINSDIHYETGCHKPVQPDETAVKDSQKWLAYTKVERESLIPLNEDITHVKKTDNDYPFINILFDCSREDAIFIAIQKNDRFAAPEVSRKGLVSYFNQVFIAKAEEDPDFQYTISIEPMLLAKHFWSRLRMACSQEGGDIKDMYLRVKNPDMEPVFKQDDEAWHAMYYIAKLRKAISASESGVNFGYDEGRCADIDVAERIFGRFVNVALQNSFEVCAKFKNGKVLSSSQVEAARYPLPGYIVGEMEEGSVKPLPPQDLRMGKLQEWFEKIYQDMKDIEEIDHAEE